MTAITGVLIAGGKSSRMGTDKLMLSHDSNTFANHAIDLLRQCCVSIFISYNGEPFLSEYPFIKDKHPNIGPLAGIAAALQNAPTNHLLVLACDMPLLTVNAIQPLIDQCDTHDITVYQHPHGCEPLCAIYHQNVLSLVIQQIEAGDYSLQRLIAKANTRFLDASPEVMVQLKNINTPTDYQQLPPPAAIHLPHCSRLILIAGTGQNSGKTTLACQLIRQFNAAADLVALKISPHRHKGTDSAFATSSAPFIIWEEHHPMAGKDTHRMQQAGASRVFYIESENQHLGDAFQMVLKQISSRAIIICESGGLREMVRPGIFIMATNPDKPPKPSALKWLLLADIILPLNEIIDDHYKCPIEIHKGLPIINTSK